MRLLYVAAAVFCVTPWAGPAIALGLGAALALALGNPFVRRTSAMSRILLQASVVGLGFGIPLDAVMRAAGTGVLYTVVGIFGALTAGVLLGRWLKVERETSWLITVGTAICGGSAIAAVGHAIGARQTSMSFALATVFLLNAVALYLFPPIAHALQLTQTQFAVWAAVAIHDTSSVVGAAALYGREALESATVLKLARALWIVPLTLAAAGWARHSLRATSDAPAGQKVPIPWFIVLFFAAALLRTAGGSAVHAPFDTVAAIARTGLVLTLFLIGAGLTRDTLRAIGPKPLLLGVILWGLVAVSSLVAVMRWIPT